MQFDKASAKFGNPDEINIFIISVNAIARDPRNGGSRWRAARRCSAYAYTTSVALSLGMPIIDLLTMIQGLNSLSLARVH